MTRTDRDRRPRSGGSSMNGSSRQYAGAGDSRARVPSQTPYHGPTGTRSRGGGMRGPGHRGRGGRGGYPLRSRSINFQGGRNRVFGIDRQLLILGALAVVLLVLVIVGVSSCVRGCSSDPAQSANQVDSRVAAGVSEELTQQFATELNRDEKLAGIAATADRYADTGLLELALSVPEAIDFVAAYPDAEKTAQPYGDTVTQGEAPQLWCWDARWGNVDYAGRALAITGSGPTALSMAYMGLTGNNDKSPADLAQQASEANAATGDSAMAASFLESSAEGLGLSYRSYTSNADNLSQALDAGTYVLLETKAGSITSTAHWILLVSENEDGSITVYDPTSPDVSAHPWAAATLAASTDTIHALSLPGSDDGTDSENAENGTAADASTTTND